MHLPRWRHHRQPSTLLALGIMTAAAALLISAASAHADVIRISSINGDYEAAHADQIDVKPGDVIQLSADIFTDNGDGTFAAQSQQVENFAWSADDAASDQCDLSQGQECLGPSNFEANDYGVSFYVPYDFKGQAITLSVTAVGGDGSTDSLVLNNSEYAAPEYTPPVEVVTDPSDYQGGTLDPQTSLAGQGNWVVIEGTRYFVPYTYQPNWVPYQNGYWSWTGDEDGDGDGWTWVSYDSWGWMTDHYGAWRHHGTYGWMWQPFEGNEWRWHHHCVTWFHDGGNDYVGWYPYYNGWHDGYRHGRAQGFDDGYWGGYENGRFYGAAGFTPGFTVIHGRDFGWNNCRERMVGGSEGIGAWRTGFGQHYYGEYPGYGRVGGVRDSRGWVEGGFHVSIPITHTVSRPIGGGILRYPVGVHPVPGIDHRPPFVDAGSMHHAFPVGSVFHSGQPGPGLPGAGRPVFTPPTAGGHGLAHPPTVFNPGNGTHVPMPPHTQHPAQPNPGNPIYHPAPIGHGPVQPPVFRPGQPVNPGHPINPGPVHPPVINHPPVPRPQPPVFHPAPGPAPAPAPRPQPPVFHPAPGPAPAPAPAPRPQPPVFHPAPAPAPAPAPRPQPPVFHPAPGPAPAPAPAPAPRPQPPVFHPAPGPAPAPAPAPAPRPQPPVFHPAPAPAPAPRPQPPVFHPAPAPAPAPAPRPAPPVYHPAPAPAPAPRPAPPVFHPAPAPAPRPAPAPAPHPAPAPGGGHGPHHIDAASS